MKMFRAEITRRKKGSLLNSQRPRRGYSDVLQWVKCKMQSLRFLFFFSLFLSFSRFLSVSFLLVLSLSPSSSSSFFSSPLWRTCLFSPFGPAQRFVPLSRPLPFAPFSLPSRTRPLHRAWLPSGTTWVIGVTLRSALATWYALYLRTVRAPWRGGGHPPVPPPSLHRERLRLSRSSPMLYLLLLNKRRSR